MQLPNANYRQHNGDRSSKCACTRWETKGGEQTQRARGRERERKHTDANNEEKKERLSVSSNLYAIPLNNAKL